MKRQSVSCFCRADALRNSAEVTAASADWYVSSALDTATAGSIPVVVVVISSSLIAAIHFNAVTLGRKHRPRPWW
jgi:hypothetical protein